MSVLHKKRLSDNDMITRTTEPTMEPTMEPTTTEPTTEPPPKRTKNKCTRVLSDFYGKPNIETHILSLLSHIGMPSFTRQNDYKYASWNLETINIDRIPTPAEQIQAIDQLFDKYPGNRIVSMVKHAEKEGNPWTDDATFAALHGFECNTSAFRNALIFANEQHPKVTITYSQAIDYRTRGGKRECRVNILHVVRFRKHLQSIKKLVLQIEEKHPRINAAANA